jgi:hypothetical protein
MIELSDADVLKMGRLLGKQYREMIHLRHNLSTAENAIYILLFCIIALVVSIIWMVK